MRILTVGNRYPPWSTGGYEVVWQASVAWLRDAGHEVRVLTTVPDPSDRPTLTRPVGVHRELRWYWRNHEFPKLSLRRTAALERANAATFARHLRELRPEAVVWWALGGMSLSLLEQARRAGIPAIGVVGDEWMVYGPRVDQWTRRWRSWLRPASGLAERGTGVPTLLDLDAAAHWLFNAGHLLSSVRESGWPLPSASILPPGVDPTHFAASPAPPWRWRLLYCGRLDPRKGVATAIEALPHLPAQAELTIHGDGERAYRDELEALAHRLGVGDRVRFGHSDYGSVPGVYANADVAVFPVRWREPWGLVPLEAMAVGRPVVASRAGGGPDEYLKADENCLRFEPGDAPGLAAAVARLAADPQLRGQLVTRGQATVARYTAAAFHQGIEAALREAVAARRWRVPEPTAAP